MKRETRVTAPTDIDSQRAFRAAIWGQCFGVQPQQALSRGLGLLYLYALGLSPQAILILLSGSVLIRGLLSVPAGYFADRIGKKRIGFFGQTLCIAGFGILTSAGWATAGRPRLLLAALGIVLFGAGTALFGAGWIALLSPLIPAQSRGRLLGRLRFARQLAAVGVGSLTAMWMTQTTPLAGFQLLFGLLTVCLVIRLLLYEQIPELEHTAGSRPHVVAALRAILAIPGYRRTCGLVSALFFAVGGIPMLFGLLEIEVLGLGDDEVWWLGVAMLVGHLVGSLAGGSLVDLVGGRRALFISQLAFAGSLMLFLARGMAPSLLLSAATASILFGMTKTTLEITTAAELIGLVPRQHKSLAISTCMSLVYLADSLAGLLIAALLPRLESLAVMRQGSWRLPGDIPATSYDLVLIALGGLLVVLLLWTLPPRDTLPRDTLPRDELPRDKLPRDKLAGRA